MKNTQDTDTLKIPAYLRKKSLISQARQKLILTALDRKEASISYKSRKALAPIKKTVARKNAHMPTGLYQESEISSDSLVPVPAKVLTRSVMRSAEPYKAEFIGTVTHYFEKIQVAIVLLCASLAQDQVIAIEGDHYLFFQPVSEMQINRKTVISANAGSHIGLKVEFLPKTGGKIYKM